MRLKFPKTAESDQTFCPPQRNGIDLNITVVGRRLARNGTLPTPVRGRDGTASAYPLSSAHWWTVRTIIVLIGVKNTQTQRADERRLACSGGPWQSCRKVSDAPWPPSLPSWVMGLRLLHQSAHIAVPSHNGQSFPCCTTSSFLPLLRLSQFTPTNSKYNVQFIWRRESFSSNTVIVGHLCKFWCKEIKHYQTKADIPHKTAIIQNVSNKRSNVWSRCRTDNNHIHWRGGVLKLEEPTDN